MAPAIKSQSTAISASYLTLSRAFGPSPSFRGQSPCTDRANKAGAVNAFLPAVVGEGYRAVIDQFLSPSAFDLAVTDIDTFFQVEMPAIQQWQFTAEDAKRINQPVLSVVGMETADMFQESHALIKQWILHAEELVIPQAAHAPSSFPQRVAPRPSPLGNP
jgi:pimeloyl-ACP methyl ester carboxylesterase